MCRPLRIEFEADRTTWSPGRRNEDASRAAAAWPAQRRFGYELREISEASGYRSHGRVVTAVQCMEAASQAMRRMPRSLEQQRAGEFAPLVTECTRTRTA